MAVIRTILLDNAERTDWRDDDASFGYTAYGTDWKPGSAGFVERDIATKMRNALAVNATYQALAAPTAAQNTAQIQALTRECNGIMRTLLASFDSNAGT